jgi:hypothetical protein
MGLDMYLEKRHYVQRWDHIKPEDQFLVTVTRGGEFHAAIKQDRICWVIEQVAYWRKANAIHKWFVDNCQKGIDECQHSYVSAKQLRELLDLVSKAIGACLTGQSPEEILPTQAGFFFGNTEYDRWYEQMLEDTRTMLEAILSEPGAENAEYYYHSSW